MSVRVCVGLYECAWLWVDRERACVCVCGVVCTGVRGCVGVYDCTYVHGRVGSQ